MEASPIFFPGQTVTFQTPERRLTFTIDRPFTPFTKAVVLLARCPELGPDPVVVKIYDPRFLDERLQDTPHCPARPWSLELERAADAVWDEPFHRRDLLVEPEDAEGGSAIPAQWEKHFRLLSTGCFKAECEVYGRLCTLQGSAIPRLLTIGIVLPPDERAIQPPAIVMEYIPDAISLCDVPVDLVTPELCASLLRTVDSFAGLGAVHADVNWNNILFTPSERPTRVVVIDFGLGIARKEDEDGEAWEESVAYGHDGWQMRWVLGQRGISVPTV
ncbi:hypothetical protein V8D89_000695 [Ganoderma adspersum]